MNYVTYDPLLARVTGSALAALFTAKLTQIWRAKDRQPFRFSWQRWRGELEFTQEEMIQAVERVALRAERESDQKTPGRLTREEGETRFIVFWTPPRQLGAITTWWLDDDKLTWLLADNMGIKLSAPVMPERRAGEQKTRLHPSTPGAVHLFEVLDIEASAKGRDGASRFPSVACKELWETAEQAINNVARVRELVAQARLANRESVTAITRYVAKAAKNGKEEEPQVTRMIREIANKAK